MIALKNIDMMYSRACPLKSVWSTGRLPVPGCTINHAQHVNIYVYYVRALNSAGIKG